MELRGRGTKLTFAAACVGLSVSAGVLASAYTTAGMDSFYSQQRERTADRDGPAADAGPEIASTAPIELVAPERGYRPDGDPPDGSSFPPIQTSR